MKINFLSVILLIFGTVTATTAVGAQTTGDLQSRYGQPDEAFYVRPNILMTVEYAKDGQISEAVIEPRDTQKRFAGKRSGTKPASVTANSEMTPEIVKEVIEEVAPVKNRGRLINSMTFNSSFCGTAESEIYETVEIFLSYTCSVKYRGDKVISSASVVWKRKE